MPWRSRSSNLTKPLPDEAHDVPDGNPVVKGNQRKFLLCFALCAVFWLSGFCSALFNNEPVLITNEKTIHNNFNFFSTKTVLLNNFFVCLKIIAYGHFSFGLYSLLCLFYNGYILGNYVVLMQGYQISHEIIATAIFPHFLEYVAMWLSGAIGLSGLAMVLNLIKNRDILTKQQIIFLLKVLVLIVFCLVFSALVEVKLSLEFALKALE